MQGRERNEEENDPSHHTKPAVVPRVSARRPEGNASGCVKCVCVAVSRCAIVYSKVGQKRTGERERGRARERSGDEGERREQQRIQ